MHDDDAALLAAWRASVDTEGAPFTVPGHKGRAGTVWPTLGRLLDSDSPMYGGLAPIKDAAALLSAAERRGAALWTADWCRYSTGGSTHVNQVAALAVARPGDTVVVSRNAHRSTLSGLILAGLEPVWLPTDVDPRFGLPAGVSRRSLEAVLDATPDATALFLVEPSYIGTTSRLAELVELAHGRGLPVVVDQAWGAHLGFHPAYPNHALQAGADVMIMSAHKMLPSYSQGSIIAARTARVADARLERAFEVSNTTSPAGSILASIDAARAVLGSPLGHDLLDRLVDVVAHARERLHAGGIVTLRPSDFEPGRFDPAKLVLVLDSGDGLEIERALIAAGAPVEQADRDTIVAIATMVDDDTTVDRLVDAVLGAHTRAHGRRATTSVWAAPVPPRAMSPRTAFFAAHDVVSAADAIGRASAELIAPYPPGIPVVVPGEIITAEVLAALEAAAASGVPIAYARDPALKSYEVVIE
jgi:lysine decarboxylase